VLSADTLRTLYALLDEGQTVDDDGRGVDCGGPCDKLCCKPDITKYLLPGERAFLASELAGRDPRAFGVGSTGFFDTILPDPSLACACERVRDLRPFNCRMFPYGARIVDKKVVDLVKGKQAYLAPCWIETPGPKWRENALHAWQLVLDDEDCRRLFAKLTTLWEWNHALEKGEEPGPVLLALTTLESSDDDELWKRAARFFGRAD
jgi:hypothetical protein